MSTKKHDVLVAGGGIGGLVAAASLADNRLSVLLVEKNGRPGGSCSSFSRQGYTFDTGTSSLSGLGEGGRLRKIFDSLGLSLSFLRPAVRETVIGSGLAVSLPADAEGVREALMTHFPGDRDALRRFLDLLEGGGAPPAKGATFADILGGFDFSPDASFFLEALLGNLGLPAGRVDGPTALAFFREYVLDGGYYPVGGMGRLPEALVERIRAGGGEVLLGEEVKSFAAANGSIEAAHLKSGDIRRASFFIDAAGIRREDGCAVPALPGGSSWERELKSLTTSPSAFMVFAGLDCRLDDLTAHRGHILSLPEGSMEEVYRSLQDDELLFSPERYVYIIVPSRIEPAVATPGGETICLFVMAPFRDAPFWKANRQRMIDALLARAEKVIPGLGGHLQVTESATPLTIRKFTGGFRGATYGWEAVPSQSGASRLSPVTPWDNLILAGHWTRPGSGISAVAYSGWMAARMARRCLKENHVPRN